MDSNFKRIGRNSGGSTPDNSQISPHGTVPSSVSKVVNILIITDSRGRGLDGYLGERNNLNKLLQDKIVITAETVIKPGLKLEEAEREITRQCLKTRRAFDHIFLLAGICNLTVKDHQTGRVTYPNRDVKENCIAVIDRLVENLGAKLHIATIAPVDLNKHYTFRNGEAHGDLELMKSQQENLVEDCNEINQHIVDININRRLPTIHWAKQCMLTTKKRDRRTKKLRTTKKFVPKHLFDGIHPNEELKCTWFKLTVDHVSKLISLENEEISEEKSTDTSQEEEASWNFKRQRVK